MKKIFPLISLIGLLAVGSAIIANPKSKVVLADNPLSGTITTNFKKIYDDSTGTTVNDFKLINDGNIPVYYSGEETNLFSASVAQGSTTEKVKVRNRNNSGTYYLYLKYNSSKAVDALGSEIVFSTGGGL